jgi:O-antigen ligase
VRELRLSGAAWAVTLLGTILVLSAGLAVLPLPTAGVFLGVALLLTILARPLWVLGFMLAIGAVDLSFVTGGRLLEDWGGIDMNGLRLLGMVAGMAAIIVLEPRALRQALGPRGRWYVLFLLFAAGTVSYSVLPIDGARLLLKLAYPLLLFLAVVAVARRRQQLERLVDWALGGAVAMSFVVVPVLLLLGEYEFEQNGRLSAAGVALHQNPLSFYMLMMALLAFARFSVRGQVRYVVLAGVCGFWIVATMTRITLLATVAAFAAVALYNAWRDRNLKLPLAAAALVLVVAIPLVPIALERTFGEGFTIAELGELVTDPAALITRMNFQGREIIWPFVGAAFLTSPVYGLGLGASTYLTGLVFPTDDVQVVHNEYLRLAADTGVIGLFLFTTAMMVWLAAAVRAGRSPGVVREFAVPAGAGLVAWAVISLTDNPFDYYASFTQYIALAVAGSVWLTEAEGAGDGEPVGMEGGHGGAGPDRALTAGGTRGAGADAVSWEGVA